MTRTRAATLGVLSGLLMVGCATTPPAELRTPLASAATAVASPPATASSPSPEASPATPASPAPTASAAPPARTVTLALTGDQLWHSSLVASVRADARRVGSAEPEHYALLFEHVAPLLRAADVAICHNEVPIAAPGQPISGYPTFAAPPSTARAIRDLGFDACTTASNHALDKGFGTLVGTLDRLETDAGVVTAGTNRTATEAQQPAIVTTASGVRVGLVTGTYGLNGSNAGRPWAVDTLDPAGLLARARAARQAGADLVVVALHAGDEYVVRPTAQQSSLARTLAASPDVDLVYGHHAHVVQPWEQVNGTWVIHGVGNLAAQMRKNTPAAQEGVIAQVTFTEAAGRFVASEVSYVPLLVTYPDASGGARVLPVTLALTRGLTDRTRLVTAQKRIADAVGRLGAQVPAR